MRRLSKAVVGPLIEAGEIPDRLPRHYAGDACDGLCRKIAFWPCVEVHGNPAAVLFLKNDEFGEKPSQVAGHPLRWMMRAGRGSTFIRWLLFLTFWNRVL